MFKLGDIVKVVEKDKRLFDSCWDKKMDKFIGQEIEVFCINDDDCSGYDVFVKCEDGMKQYVNDNFENGWWFPSWCLKLISHPEKPGTYMGIEYCPKCKGNLQEKYSEYAGENIKKCKECGWC